MNKNTVFIKRFLFYCLFAVMSVILPLLTWIFLRGAFHEFIDQFFIFNFKYVGVEGNSSSILFAYLKFISRPTIILYIISMIIPLFAYRTIDNDTFWLIIRGLFVSVITFIVIISPGRSYVHYMLLIFPLASLFICINIYILIQLFSKTKHKMLCISLIYIAIAYLVIVPNIIQSIDNAILFCKEDIQKSSIVKYIVENSSENDQIVVATPDDCWVYLASDRCSATKYPYAQAAIIGGIIENNRLVEYLDQIKNTRPAYIVVQNDHNWYKHRIAKTLNYSYNIVYSNQTYSIYKRITYLERKSAAIACCKKKSIS